MPLLVNDKYKMSVFVRFEGNFEQTLCYRSDCASCLPVTACLGSLSSLCSCIDFRQ